MKWKKWAVDLEHDEKNLKATMPDHLKKILQPKQIRLWEKLLREGGYKDMGVVSEMISETSLVGETEVSGLWPAKFTPAMLTEDELLEISARDKWANLDRIALCPNPDTDKQVWEKAMAGRDKSWILGPFRPYKVPDHCPLSRRFGVVQGPKIRYVDDFTSPDHRLTWC